MLRTLKSFAELARKILRHHKALRAGCTIGLVAILIAALYPFHAPINQVSHLSDRDGLFLGEYGSILSSAEFKTTTAQVGFCTLEFVVKPAEAFASGDIAAFSTQSDPVHFEIGQRGSDLFVIREIPDDSRHRTFAHIAVDDVFRLRNTLFIAITSGPYGTSVYLDGARVKAFPQFSFTSRDLIGRLVIGNSPVGNTSWSGYVSEIGIFEREWTEAQVLRHYADWTTSRGTGLARNDSAKALYVFNERTGGIVHNQVSLEPNLEIPKHYFVLHPQFLRAPWEEFEGNWDYLENFTINIAAFIPLGTFMSAYFSSVLRIKRPLKIAILTGLVLSLSIEILQGFLPTRDSGMTDIITNATGAALGAWLYFLLMGEERPAQVAHTTSEAIENREAVAR